MATRLWTDLGFNLKRIISILLGIFIFTFVGVPKDVNSNDSYVTYEELKIHQEKQAEREWSSQLTAHAQKLVGKKTGHCVLALRNYFGVPRNEVQGMAKNTKTNSTTGKIGSVIIFKNLSKYGHVGLIIDEDPAYWYYFHSNIDWRGTGRIDRIAKNDSHISGYRIIKYN
jgi:hypothetical protein